MQEYTVKEWQEGTQKWYKNGLLHRDNGPAIVYSDGERHWYRGGELHKKDGPAVVRVDGRQEWWLNGNQYTYEEWKLKIGPDTCDGRVVEIEGKKYKLQEI